MRPSCFKYFSCLQYARDFMDGRVFFRTAAFFHDPPKHNRLYVPENVLPLFPKTYILS